MQNISDYLYSRNRVLEFINSHYSKFDEVEMVTIVPYDDSNPYKLKVAIIVKANNKDAFEAIKIKEKLAYNQIMEEELKETCRTCGLHFEYEFVYQ